MATRPKTGLDHRAYRRAKNQLRKTNTTCWICTRKIDTRTPDDGGPEYGSALEWTADHVQPRSKGGSLLGELKPAHRGCNSARGNRMRTRSDTMPTTREW